MRSTEIIDDKQARYAGLATAEIWLGGILVAALTVRQILGLLGLEHELHGVAALLPLLLLWSGLLMIAAGAAMRRFHQYAFLCHVPLLLWLVVFFLAFI